MEGTNQLNLECFLRAVKCKDRENIIALCSTMIVFLMLFSIISNISNVESDPRVHHSFNDYRRRVKVEEDAKFYSQEEIYLEESDFNKEMPHLTYSGSLNFQCVSKVTTWSNFLIWCVWL